MATKKRPPRILEICATLGVTISYFAILAAYFWASMVIIQQFEGLHTKQRSKYLEQVTISYYPIPPGELVKGSAIWYNKSREYYINKYTSQLLEIVNKEYQNRNDVKYVHCNYTPPFDPKEGSEEMAKNNQVCRVYDPEFLDWGNCTPTGKPFNESEGPFELSSEAFGYKEGSPCVLLRPNHVLDWNPSNYIWEEGEFNESEIGSKYLETFEKANITSSDMESYLWILCDGERDEDREQMGNLVYHPANRIGIPKFYYPYKNQPGFLMPFLFIQFVNPVPFVVIRIKCELFAGIDEKGHNGQHVDGKTSHEGEPEKSMHASENVIRFELLIDDININDQ